MSEQEILNKSQDSYRQRAEIESMKVLRAEDSIAMESCSKILSRLSALKCEAISVRSYKSNLTNSEKGFNGTLHYLISMVHGGDNKTAEVSLEVKDSVVEPIEVKITEETLTSTPGEKSVLAAKIREEIDARLALFAAPTEKPIEKSAAAGPCAPNSFLSPVIHADKQWLPSCLKPGEFVFLGGAKYVVVNDDHAKLSADSDGHMWTLQLVSEISKAKKITDGAHIQQ
jgi:hypothetical protein